MKSFREVAEYWDTEHPERDFERMRPLLRLARLANQVPSFQKAMLEPHGLSPSEYSILGALRRAGGPRQLQPEDLYNAVGCTPGGLSKMIDRLEKRGLVQRMHDASDRRRALIRLTPQGATLEREAFGDLGDGAERAMAQLAPEELQRVNFALDMLAAIFEAPETYLPPSQSGEKSLAEVRAALAEAGAAKGNGTEGK